MSETATHPASEERLLDANAIEEASKTLTRPTAVAHLEALVTKLRRDASALKRHEDSKTLSEKNTHNEIEKPTTPVTRALSNPPPPIVLPTPPPAVTMSTPSSHRYENVERFSFDAGGYNAQFLSLYVPLPRVGSIPKSDIKVEFTSSSVDMIVSNLEGKSTRFFRDNLEKDINPEKSKYIVKADKIVLKLAKIKGEYGSYDHWSGLTAKKKKSTKKDDPSASIMELMKDMYNDGDDNMKKMIGETMMKQQRGELGKGGLDDDM